MSSPASDSEAAGERAFRRLHPAVQQWIYDAGWQTLRDVQIRSIDPILTPGRDVIISAGTAAGKTEAAFLPIFTELARPRWGEGHEGGAPTTDTRTKGSGDDANRPHGFEVLYLAPLKALINDQHERISEIAEYAGIPVHRWHGDVGSGERRRALESPGGVLQTTPESLEAQFVLRGHTVSTVFRNLRFIVIDELHAFIGSPRGTQVRSLLHRVEAAIARPVPKVALSATLGDFDEAKSFLRPGAPDQVEIINSTETHGTVHLQLRGYLRSAPDPPVDELVDPDNDEDSCIEEDVGDDVTAIADHLFKTLRGDHNLVFANSRRAVEIYADQLSSRSVRQQLPDEFDPHHGNLSKDFREFVEARLNDRSRPFTAVCTSTLEMGIDIAAVKSIAQVGTPPTVASLRQRLGRSGRRDEAPILRIYAVEQATDSRSSMADDLRCNLVQSIAMVELMLERWIEPGIDRGLNLSTLIQQILSVIAERGGAPASGLHQLLCGPGPFVDVDPGRFARLLRSMASHDLITQASDGLLLPGEKGERFINHYSFYTAFHTADEWRLLADGRPLGTLPIHQPLSIGGLLIFAGRRWRITDIDPESKIVGLTPAGGGRPPKFSGGGISVDDRVRLTMKDLYLSQRVPPWIDSEAVSLLAEGRSFWQLRGLDEQMVLDSGRDTIIAPWVGDRALDTMVLALRHRGLDASAEGPFVTVLEATPAEVLGAVDSLVATDKPDPRALAAEVENHEIDKWDWVLDEELAIDATAARAVDIEGAWGSFARVAESEKGRPRKAHVHRTEQEPSCLDDSGVVGDRERDEMGDLLGDGRRFIVLDIETTGLSSDDRVVEIAALAVEADGTVRPILETLVNPRHSVGPTRIHGLTDAMVSDAPTFDQLAGALASVFDGSVIVGHNVSFDQRILSREFGRLGITVEWGRSLDTYKVTGRKLEESCREHGVTLDEPLHSAGADARATTSLFMTVWRRFRQPGTAAAFPRLISNPVALLDRQGRRVRSYDFTEHTKP